MDEEWHDITAVGSAYEVQMEVRTGNQRHRPMFLMKPLNRRGLGDGAEGVGEWRSGAPPEPPPIARSDQYYYCREHDDPLGWSVGDRGTVIARGDKCLCAALAELLNGRSDGGLLSRAYPGAFNAEVRK